MKSRLARLAFVVVTGVPWSTTLIAQEEPVDPALAGVWTGAWIHGSDTLPVTFHFEVTDGAWRGRFDSERLRVQRIPFQEVTFDPPRLRLRLVGDETTTEFEGRIDRDSLFGTFTEGGDGGRFVLYRDSRPVFDLPEQEVRFRNGDVELAGTLVVPVGPRPNPAVVFLHGSGPEGRWASAYLARRLAAQGIAALIWDKRGVGGSTGSWEKAGFEDVASDVAAAVAFLRARPDVDPHRVGIHGHSQGGTIAPLVAVRSGADFVIASAASGVSMAEAEIYSLANFVGIDSLPPEEAALARAYIEALVDVAYRGAPRQGLDSLAARARGAEWFFAPPEPEAAYWSFSRRIVEFDPLAWWRRVGVPVLLVYGSEDERVPVEQSRSAIVRVIEDGERAPIETRVFKGADHTFRVRRPGDHWPRTVEGYPEAVLDWLEDTVGESASAGAAASRDRLPKRSLELPTGITMAYVEAGDPSGEPVILLHGYTDTSRSFFPTIERLVALDPGLRVLAPDQRGHGASSMPEPGRCRAAPERCLRPRDFAADIIAFMDGLGIPKALVVGHSMGGMVAQEVALTSPERVDRLVLVGTWASMKNHPVVKDFLLAELVEGPWKEALVARGHRFPGDAYELTPMDIPEAVEWIAENWVVDPVADPDFVASVLPETARTRLGTWIGVARALNEVDNREPLAQLTVPTLVIWATQDGVALESDQAVLRAALDTAAAACRSEYFWKTYGRSPLPPSGLQETDIGHNVQWGAPAAVATDIAAFLREGRPTDDLFFADPDDLHRIQTALGDAQIVEGRGTDCKVSPGLKTP